MIAKALARSIASSRSAASLFSRFAAILLACHLFGGCTASRPSGRVIDERRKAEEIDGARHVVRPGETLWRIAKTYGVPVDEIVRANKLESAKIAVGQALIIPNANLADLGGYKTAEARSKKAFRDDQPPGDSFDSSNDDDSDEGEEQETEQKPASRQATPTSKSRSEAPGAATAVDSEPKPEPAPRMSLREIFDIQRRQKDRAPEVREMRSLPSSNPGTPGRTLIWPAAGVLYARFGPRAETRHDGIDIAAPDGTAIRSAADGEVLFSGKQKGYGLLIIIQHQDGLITLYAHNRENLVQEGTRVRAGEVIARMGAPSPTSGPHLHFEVREKAMPRDPLKFLPPPK